MFSKRGYVPDIRPRECIKKYCPLGGISQYTPNVMSFNITPVASEYQEIHTFSVVNVSNIKINTKMREWPIFKQAHLWVHVKNLVFL